MPAHTRPLRPSHRRGRVPSRLALADASYPCARHACAALARAAARRARRPRGAASLLARSVEAGHGCPISMTYAAVPAAARVSPTSLREWEPRFTSLDYDPRSMPAAEKSGALCGMAMTEQQGGSRRAREHDDARAARPPGPGEAYAVAGHKWFCSAPMCDAFLVLAQAEGGLSCFLLPRWRRTARATRFHIQRLKDKLGNRSNASSEVDVRRCLGAAGRRGGTRRSDDHRDGQPHAPRLRRRFRGPRCARRSRRRRTTRRTARLSADGSSSSR